MADNINKFSILSLTYNQSLRMLKKIYFFVAIAVFVFVPFQKACQARVNVTNWYIKDFQSDIQVEKNSSLLITEKIIADCGNAPNKHGIFRILPTKIKLDDGSTNETPIELLSITDFNKQSIPYAESLDSNAGTITWKIGDPNKTVTGENDYLISYRVYNTIRFANPNFDELYWNLNGNFWDLETDNFRAVIRFPSEVNENNTKISYYTGPTGSKSTNLATLRWSAPNNLEFQSTGMLPMRQGITASVTFPKGIFTAYLPKNLPSSHVSEISSSANNPLSTSLGFFFPIFTFICLFFFWYYFGKDPAEPKTIIPEYDPPASLSPLEMDVLRNNGKLRSQALTAEIIYLAVKGVLKIKETQKKFWIFKTKDYELTRTGDQSLEAALNEPQKKILDTLFQFGSDGRVNLSDLKNKFTQYLKEIEGKTREELEKKSLVLEYSYKYRNYLGIAAFCLLGIGFFLLKAMLVGAGIGIIVSGFMTAIFAPLMARKTVQGAEIDWKIKGFKLFMKTAEKYRAEFNEKENIFEKLLPYAVAFGITKLWIKKMKDLYGDDFYASYAPAWYVGSLGGAAFDADSLSSSISSLSSAIGSNVSSSSGSGGAGGSGGGGGGGGGGGW